MILSGRVALVTGASSGIGAAISGGLSREGAAVMLAARDADRGKKILDSVRAAGSRAELMSGDLTDAGFCSQLVAGAIQTFGRLDIVVNNAGIIYRGTAVDTPDDVWRRSMAVNVDAVFFVSRAAVPAMRASGGSIINMASTVALVGSQNLAAYCATKGAVLQLTRAMALDHAREHIRVNAVCPGAVDTPLLVSGYERLGLGPNEVLQANAEAIPQGRIARAEEVADLVVFLASDRAQHITGAAISIDGGYTAQ
jgi:meso-butanediol dehydrogenase / (S,S)-butanediol dehydrogenase / diacetyl reductase